MRLIDADVFKQYCSEGLEEMKHLFKTDKGLELAIKTTESFLKDIDEQPTVEAQPNRCDSCIHSDERDGSNCYECVKGMADNFEAQPTEECEENGSPWCLGHCPYNTDAQSTDAVSREAALLALTGIDLPTDRDKLIALFTNRIQHLPSVTPRTNLAETSQDCISILNRIMEYTYGMLTAEKIGLQHLIKSMMDELSGGDSE